MASTTQTDPSSILASSHLKWLDSLRALAALWVVVYHALCTVGFRDVGRLPHVVTLVQNNGHFAVTTFIAISGFSLARWPSAHGWRLRGGYREFIVSRWIRIVPPYYLSIVLSLLLIATLIGTKTGTHWDVSIPVAPQDVLFHLLLVQNVMGSPKINHVYWSVALECQIYLFFGLMLWGMRWRGLSGTLAVGGALAFAGTLAHLALRPYVVRGLANDDGYTLGAYFLVFAFGVCACRHAADLRSAGRPLSAAWALLAVALMLAGTKAHSLVNDLLFGLGASVLLLTLSESARLARPFSFTPLATIGTFAYSLYLIHAPILQVVYVLGRVWRPTDSFGRAMAYLAVAMPICVGGAYLFYLVCERPFFRLHRTVLGEKAASAS